MLQICVNQHITLLFLICGIIISYNLPELHSFARFLSKVNRSHMESNHHRLGIKNVLEFSFEIC